MHENAPRRPRRTVGISWKNAIGSGSIDQPHAITVTDIAVACAALDYGYAAWFAHQVNEVIAREEEDNLAGDGRLAHNDRRGR
jgi:hypothetical protein